MKIINKEEVKILMRKRILALALCVMLAFTPAILGGCAGTFCSNAPTVASSLQTTVDILKAQVAQLQGVLLNGYDAEIEMAYLAAKVALTGAQALLKQVCPDPVQVSDVVKNADVVIAPQVRSAYKRAAKLNLVKP
jgi:hypothetical protein